MVSILLVVNLITLNTILGQDIYLDNFDRFDLGPDWVADENIKIVNNELANISTQEKWDFLAIYAKIQNPDQLAFRWGINSDEPGINSAGFALMLDSPTLQANGYLVWKHTVNNKIDIWTIENGAPGQSISQVEGLLSKPVAGDEMNVLMSTDDDGHHFDIYVNGEFDARISDPAKLQGNTSNHYAGVMLRGNLNNNIDDFKLITKAGDDVEPPSKVTDLSAEAVSESDIRLTWTAPGDDGKQGVANRYDLRYSTFRLNESTFSGATQIKGAPSPSESGTLESVLVSGLKPETLYFFAIKTIDAALNSSVISNIDSMKTIGIDIIPVVLNVTDISATITWETDEDCNSKVEYGLDLNYGMEIQDTSYVTSHIIELSMLEADTTYHVRIESWNRNGDMATSGDFTFKTAEEGDLTAPLFYNIKKSKVTRTGVTISWSTDEPSDSFIKFGLDTVYSHEISDTNMVTEHRVVLTELVENSVYFYQISSRDWSGNIATTGDFTFMTDFTFGPLPDDAIHIYEKNPYYFSYKDKPVLLISGSDDDNIFNFPDLMLQNFDILQQIGGNYIRCTMSSRNEGNEWPFIKDDQGKYDLDRFNPEYWHRFENCLHEAAARDIIVQVEIWATFDFYREHWLKNPFNPANNKTYTTENTFCEEEWPFHPADKSQPFVYSVPEHNNDTILLEYQTRFVQKLLSISSKFGNVLYCIDNETSAPFEWASYWARFIQDKAKSANDSVLMTEMWNAHDLQDDQHKGTYEHPDLFAFFDISQNNWQIEQAHYDNILWIKDVLQDHGGKRPLTNTKVYQCLEDESEHPMINLDRWWQNIFAGCASTRFHRPTCGLGLTEISQQTVKAAHVFFNTFNIFESQSQPGLLSDRDWNEAYCLANPGVEYALYFPKGGQVELEIENSKRNMFINWFNPFTATFVKTEKVSNRYHANVLSPDTLQTWLGLVNNTQMASTEIDSSSLGIPQIISTIPMENDLVIDQSSKNSLSFKVFAFDPDNDPLRYFWTLSAHGKTQIVSVSNFYDFVYTDYLDGFHEITAFISDGKNTKKHVWSITVNTTVRLSQFTAHVVDYNGVNLEWQTSDEMNTAGFYVLRSISKGGEYKRLNSLLISVNHEKKYQFMDRQVEAGKTYYYKLQDVDNRGMINQHEPIFIKVNSPEKFALLQNFPNPFNSITTIPYHVPQMAHIKLTIFNIKGQKVKVLLDQMKEPGFYTSSWEGKDDNGNRVASGVYFYSVLAKEFTQTRQMLLLQ